MIYLIGSLRNPEIPKIANALRAEGFDIFDDWYSAGPEADDKWREYEIGRGHNYVTALNGFAAKHVFSFDYKHLDRATTVVLALPAGKSGHLELGWALGRGKKGYVLLDNPDRWDVMYQFAAGVTTDFQQLISWLGTSEKTPLQRNALRLSGGSNSLPGRQRGPEQKPSAHRSEDYTFGVGSNWQRIRGEQPAPEQGDRLQADGPEPRDASLDSDGVFATPDWFDRGTTS